MVFFKGLCLPNIFLTLLGFMLVCMLQRSKSKVGDSFRSRPGKPNQRKGQNEKFMNFAHFWVNSGVFPSGKQARFTLNICSRMRLRKVHELTFLWFGLPGPLLIRLLCNCRSGLFKKIVQCFLKSLHSNSKHFKHVSGNCVTVTEMKLSPRACKTLKTNNTISCVMILKRQSYCISLGGIYLWLSSEIRWPEPWRRLQIISPLTSEKWAEISSFCGVFAVFLWGHIGPVKGNNLCWVSLASVLVFSYFGALAGRVFHKTRAAPKGLIKGTEPNIRSGPGKPNQKKGQYEKFMHFAHFCEFWCFSLGKQARFTLNFCSGMPLRKVHELTFLWFGLPGPLLTTSGFLWVFRELLRFCAVTICGSLRRPTPKGPCCTKSTTP